MPEIVGTEGALGGEPRLSGRRISVPQVADVVLEADHSPAHVADQLSLSLAEVHAALACYYDNPDEMAEIRERHGDLEEKLAERALPPDAAHHRGMERVDPCVDENVPDACVTALRSNGFVVLQADVEGGEGTSDELLSQWRGEQRYVLLTNDRDFVELDATVDHAGMIGFTSRASGPGEVARALRRIDRQYARDALEDALVRLDDRL